MNIGTITHKGDIRPTTSQPAFECGTVAQFAGRLVRVLRPLPPLRDGGPRLRVALIDEADPDRAEFSVQAQDLAIVDPAPRPPPPAPTRCLVCGALSPTSVCAACDPNEGNAE